MAIFAALRFRNWSELARDLRISRHHLVAIRGVRESGVGFKLAILVDNILGPRHKWLMSGEGAVFDVERVPAKVRRIFEIMAPIILDLLRQRLGPGEGLPVFENLDAVTATPPELLVDPPPDKIPPNAFGSTEPLTRMTWRAYRRRPAGLPGATIGDAYYLKLDSQTKQAFDAAPGDLVLFASAGWFAERFPPAEGDSLICLLEAKGKRRIARMEVSETVAPEKGGDTQRKVKPTNSVMFRDEMGTKVVLRPAKKVRLAAGETVLAAAIKVERDLAGT